MRNHVHLLLTPSRINGVSAFMHAANEIYARDVERAAAVWEDRYEASPVYVRRYVLGCMRYIELNPVCAGLVKRPGDYRWSSFCANALGKPDALVTPHPFYYGLGRSVELRQAAYRTLFQDRPKAWKRQGADRPPG
jgi:putative transposase